MAQEITWAIEARKNLTRRLRLNEPSLFPITDELYASISGEKENRKGEVR